MCIKTIIGKNVRRIRQDQQLSQENVAEMAGLNRSYIGGVERGEHTLGVVNLEKIAIAMKVTPAILLAEPTPATVTDNKKRAVKTTPAPARPAVTVTIHWPTFATMLDQCRNSPDAIRNYMMRAGIEVRA